MAIKKVYELAVDLKRTSVRVNIPVLVQGDSAEFRIRLLDNGAELSTEQLTGITKVSMQSGYDAQTVIQTVGALQGSVAVFRLKKNELFRSGTVQAMVQLEDTEDRISTLRFQYQVIPDLAGNYIPGEQDITVFQRYMNEAQAKIDEMAATDVSQFAAQLAETEAEAKRKKEPEDLSPRSLELITGNGVVNLLSIPQKNSVTYEKTDFLKPSSNLYNADKKVLGALDVSTGAITESTAYYTTDHIPVTAGLTYTVKDFNRYVCYDANLQIVNGNHIDLMNPVSITPPTGAVTMRLSSPNLARALSAQVNRGNSLLPLEPYYVTIDKLKVNSSSLEGIKFGKDNVDFIKKTSNLFFKENYNEGFNIDNSTGELVENSSYTVSDFIKVDPSKTYSALGVMKIGRYTGSKTYITNINTSQDEVTTFTPNAEYIKLIFRVAMLDIVQINEGESLLPYEDAGYFLDESIRVKGTVENSDEESVLDLWEEDRFVVEGELTSDYTVGSEDVTALSQTEINSTQFYAMYDELMNEFPEYISKKHLANDGEGSPIYQYDFMPTPVPKVPASSAPIKSNTQVDTKFPKMVLISANHGSERIGAYNLFNTLKQITKKWKTNSSLETLRWNVHFIVIPIVNVYGFNNIQRTNENGVDLSRNYPIEFETNTAVYGDSTYGGVEPFSEVGSQVVAQVLEENDDIVYFGSYHNYGAQALDDFIWIPGATKLQVQLSKRLVTRMTAKWKKEYDWFPQGDDFYIGYGDNKAPSGSEGMYAASLGIQAGTFETSNIMIHEENPAIYNLTATRLGTEVFINWLIINLRENVKFYNSL